MKINGLWMVLGVLAAVMAAGGCRTAPEQRDYARAYPGGGASPETINVQVFRHTKTIEFTNTTARAFGPSTLWLNARFSRPIEGLAVGETIELPFSEFVDEYSEPFRGGGFFATEAPDRLVLTQLETTRADGERAVYGLVVVDGRP